MCTKKSFKIFYFIYFVIQNYKSSRTHLWYPHNIKFINLTSVRKNSFIHTTTKNQLSLSDVMGWIDNEWSEKSCEMRATEINLRTFRASSPWKLWNVCYIYLFAIKRYKKREKQFYFSFYYIWHQRMTRWSKYLWNERRFIWLLDLKT